MFRGIVVPTSKGTASRMRSMELPVSGSWRMASTSPNRYTRLTSRRRKRSISEKPTLAAMVRMILSLSSGSEASAWLSGKGRVDNPWKC